MDQDNVKSTAEAASELLKSVPIYQDALQPAMIEIGKNLETVAKTVRIALSPLSALVWGYEQISEYLESALTYRLQGLPLDRIKTPSIAIAGPAIQSLSFASDLPELREMWANLIATSMDIEVSHKAHPSFVEVIRQLDPNEALIINCFASKRYQPWPMVHICTDIKPSPETEMRGYILTPYRNISLLPIIAGCSAPDLYSAHIDNLVRLGLVELLQGRLGHNDMVRELYNSELLQGKLAYLESAAYKLYCDDYMIKMTDFGQLFIDSCVTS
ncbi:MAG: DUF4393 domain-containing protein [Calditrichaeota bacterium]|nr:DUF4393 domain-containing protein [Calditrichota bacterium]